MPWREACRVTAAIRCRWQERCLNAYAAWEAGSESGASPLSPQGSPRPLLGSEQQPAQSSAAASQQQVGEKGIFSVFLAGDQILGLACWIPRHSAKSVAGGGCQISRVVLSLCARLGAASTSRTGHSWCRRPDRHPPGDFCCI